MTLEDFLDKRYRVISRLPAFSPTHQRYALHATSGTAEKLVLSFQDYTRSVGVSALEQQRQVSETMMRPPVALLCRVIEARFEPEFQATISEFPGEISLREVLQQRQSLSIEEVEAFLRLLTEACESAVTFSWPRLELDAAHLYLDPRLGLPRIPAPDVPSFESVGSDADIDPLQTMQFNAADLRASMEPLPHDTKDYVLPLAALCCDLLGQPQTLRGGNARYQPVPQLTSQQNVLLRRALTSEGRLGFTSAKAFMDEFFGVSFHQDLSSHTERIRTLTVTMSSRTMQMQQEEAPPLTTPSVNEASAFNALIAAGVTLPAPPPMPPPLPVVAPLVVSTADREEAEKMPPTERLRMVPGKEDSPILALLGGSSILLGRSAADADFIAQFRPRSNINDGRSRRISRTQCRAHLLNGKIRLEESSAVNPSVVQDIPLAGHANLDFPTNFLLAGEYPIEIRRIPSDYPLKREILDVPDAADVPLDGAALIRAGGSGVLLCEAALIQSDIGIYFSKSGRPWFRAEGAAPAARIHLLWGQFWLEPIEASVISTGGSGTSPAKAHHLILLREGMSLRLGVHGYTVQSYKVAENTGETV